MTKIAGSGSISQRHRSADPDPPQNVMDPQHWLLESVLIVFREFFTRYFVLAFFISRSDPDPIKTIRIGEILRVGLFKVWVSDLHIFVQGTKNQ
jgi:hypothetical protein